MDIRASKHLDILMERYPLLGLCKSSIAEAYELLRTCYEQGGKLLVCGNGGSCADAEHIVGELMKSFCQKRTLPQYLRARLMEVSPEHGEMLGEQLEQGLPAIALGAHTALNTAYANDKNPELIFAQQLMGYGRPGDVLLGISTSGNSANIVYAVETARALGLRTMVLSGKDGGALAKLAELAIVVPSMETYQIQELHLPIYHTLCLMLEDTFFA